MLSDLWIRVRSLLRRKTVESELDDELRFHLEQQIEKHVKSGMASAEARRRARIELGGLEQTKEKCRDARGVRFLEALTQDTRFALRLLRKSPAFTLVAVLTFALGIGASTAMFAIVNAVLLRPLPFPNQNRLVTLWETEPIGGASSLSGKDYVDWQSASRSMQAMSLFTFPQEINSSNSRGAGATTRVGVQSNFFSVLGVQPLIGRAFVAGEDQAGRDHVAILSYGFWQSRFGGRRSVIGKTVYLNEAPYTIVGVMPRWFHFPETAKVWITLDMGAEGPGMRGNHDFQAIGRLKPGVTIGQAQAEFSAIAERLSERYPKTNTGVGALVVPLREQLTASWRQTLLLLFGAAVLILLLACANVANLLLAHATGRRREMAARLALGATRGRLLSQLLTQSNILSLGGAGFGVVAAWWAVHLVRSLRVLPVPLQSGIRMDGVALFFTIGASLLAGILSGAVPALYAREVNLSDALRSDSRTASPLAGSQRLRSILVIGEIAVSVALLSGAGLLLRSYAKLRGQSAGLNPEHVVAAGIILPASRYPTPAAKQEFCDRFLARVQRLPGVRGAAVSTAIPLEGESDGWVTLEDQKNPVPFRQVVEWNKVTPDYFHVLGIPFLQGRNFSAEDVTRTALVAKKLGELMRSGGFSFSMQWPESLSFVAVVNHAMVDTYWPERNPLGKVFRMGGVVPVRVIGVVDNVKEWSMRQAVAPQAYFPITQTFGRSTFTGNILVKTDLTPAVAFRDLRSALRSLDSGLAIVHPRTMDTILAQSTIDTAIPTALIGLFAVLGLLLAVVGIYGVMSYLVAQREHEVGIRMALGAQGSDVLALVFRQGAKLIILGMTIGLAGGLAVSRMLTGLLYGVTPTDPAIFALVAALLGGVALVACYVPARRAMRVDPMTALRHE